MSEMKPCPFCGGEAQVNTWTMHGITESRCFCSNSDCPNSVRTVALEQWNTRPIEDALTARAKRAEAEVARLQSMVERCWGAEKTLDGARMKAEMIEYIEAFETEIAKLETENAKLRDVIGDYRNDVSRVLDEKCPSDERHCGCVPILRDQLNKYQKALILITTMPELSQATTIAREALQERGKFIWTEQSVGEYWVTKLDILQDRFDALEKDYADVCQKRLEAADVFSRQIIELERDAYDSAMLEAGKDWERERDEHDYLVYLLEKKIASLEAEVAELRAYRDGFDPKEKLPEEGQMVLIEKDGGVQELISGEKFWGTFQPIKLNWWWPAPKGIGSRQ